MKDFFKLVFGGYGLLLLVVVLLASIGWFLAPINKMVERQVFKQSYQYQEGMAERTAVLQASLAEIEARLASDTIDKTTRDNLLAQRAAINVQLQATRR